MLFFQVSFLNFKRLQRNNIHIRTIRRSWIYSIFIINVCHRKYYLHIKTLLTMTSWNKYCILHCLLVTSIIPLISVANVASTLTYLSTGKVSDPDWLAFPSWVLATGQVVWAPSGTFESSCDLNMYNFPFDSQKCSLDFGNMIHLESSVRLFVETDSPINLDFFVPSKEFRYH